MAEQAFIISKMTDLFAEKLEGLYGSEGKLEVVTEEDESKDVPDNDMPKVRMVLLGAEEKILHNMFEQLRLREADEKGNVTEFFANKATRINLQYIIIPYCTSKTETYKTLGLIVKQIKDNPFLEVGDYDWVENNGKPVMIETVKGMDIDKQMQIFSMLNMKYRPSLFYQFLVGIDSGRKEIFSRVTERKIEVNKDSSVNIRKERRK
ncbi:MAG: DUF4255 domain-containing protein [bacterium]|nr:DUF4255 domain-containing protein [bacterium]